MQKIYLFCALCISLSTLIYAQTFEVPEILYYKFNNGTTTTPNYAFPGQGDNPVTLTNMFMGPGGQFDSALVGNGGTGSTTYLSSGWNMNTGTSSWTISLWINNYPAATFGYIFGNDITTSFRCFSAGAAGTGNITLRGGGGFNNVDVTGVLPGPSVVHFVYDSSVPEIRTYLNGVFQSAVSQPPLNIIATVPFKVGSYGTTTSIPVGSLIDEFRFYNRALDADEIGFTWNQTLPVVIPVELTSFTASVIGTDVQLSWATASETNNMGFEVERGVLSPEYGVLRWENIGFVDGYGTTTELKSYSFIDEKVEPGIYFYRLKQIDFDGTFEYSFEVEVEMFAPADYILEQNYPNPFNPSTQIRFAIPEAGRVKLEIYNLLGQKISDLLDEDLSAGYHTVDFSTGSFGNAENLSSGVYIYTINANGFVSSKKMILLR
jgi:hypothetical protein